MAVSVLHSAQVNSASTLSGLTAATAGSTLVCMVTQTAVQTTPTISDNIGGSWAVSETKAEPSTTSAVFCAIKKAAGGETEIKATAGAGGTIVGITYCEASGASTEIRTILGTGKQASALTHASEGLAVVTGDLVFCAFGAVINAEVSSWNNAMTDVSTAVCRCAGGFLVTTGTGTTAYTATLKEAKAGAVLGVVIKPSGGSALSRTTADTIETSSTADVSIALGRTVGDTVAVSDAAARTVALARAVGDTVAVSDAATRAVALSRAVGDTVAVSDAAARLIAVSSAAADTIAVSDSAAVSRAMSRTTADTISVSDAATQTPGKSREVAVTIIVSDSLTSSSSVSPVIVTVEYGAGGVVSGATAGGALASVGVLAEGGGSVSTVIATGGAA